MFAFCFSSNDKYILDAAKLLLDAGADPLFEIDPFSCEEKRVLDQIAVEISAALPANGSLVMKCLFVLLYDIMEAKVNGEPYAAIDWPDAVIGKKITGVYSSGALPEHLPDDPYPNCFREDIILDCEGTPLTITDDCLAYVNPYQRKDWGVDMSGHLGALIGKRITDVQLDILKHRDGIRSRFRPTLIISVENDTTLYVRSNAGSWDEEYCAWFEVAATSN